MRVEVDWGVNKFMFHPNPSQHVWIEADRRVSNKALATMELIRKQMQARTGGLTGHRGEEEDVGVEPDLGREVGPGQDRPLQTAGTGARHRRRL